MGSGAGARSNIKFPIKLRLIIAPPRRRGGV